MLVQFIISEYLINFNFYYCAILAVLIIIDSLWRMHFNHNRFSYIFIAHYITNLSGKYLKIEDINSFTASNTQLKAKLAMI